MNDTEIHVSGQPTKTDSPQVVAIDDDGEQHVLCSGRKPPSQPPDGSKVVSEKPHWIVGLTAGCRLLIFAFASS